MLARVCAGAGVTRLLERLLHRDALLVLNYHRVGNAEETPYDSGTFGPTAEQFDWQLGYLKSRFQCVGLDEAVSMITGNVAMRQSLLITFDDGYLDNYEIAFPMLRSHGMQATFFLPTSFIATRRVPWWDTIAYIVKHSRKNSFKITYPQAAEFQVNKTEPSATVFQLLSFCVHHSTTDYSPLIEQLENECDCARPNGSSERCFLNWDEAREMQAAGMSFGSHTHNHEVLSGLALDRQLGELTESRAILERELGRTIDTLAYPVGQPYTFNSDTLAAVEHAGYRAAFSFYGGANLRENLDWRDVRRGDTHSPDAQLFRLQTTLAAVGRKLA